MDPLRQPIELEFVPPKVGKPLAGLIAHLKQVDAYLDQINAKLGAGPKLDPKFTQSVEEINKKLLKTFSGTGHSAEAMAKSLGLDQAQTDTVLRRLRTMRNEIEGLSKRGLSFNTVENAARGFGKAFDAELASLEKRYANLGKLLTPTMAEVAGQPVGGKATVSGIVPLVIDAKQIQASVAGMVNVVIPGSQVSGAGGQVSGGRNAKGEFVAAEGGSGSGKGKASGGIQPVPKGVPGSFKDEASRTLTQTEKGARVAVETLIGGGQSLTKTFNDVGDEIKRVTKDPKLRNLGKQLREDLTVFRKQAEADMLNTRTGDKVKDLLGVAKIKGDLADNVRKSFAAVAPNLPEPARKALGRVYETQARVFDAQAREATRLSGVVDTEQKAAAQKRQQKAQEQANAYFEQQQRERAKEVARLAALNPATSPENRALNERLLRAGRTSRTDREQAARDILARRLRAQRAAERQPEGGGLLDKLFGGDGRMVTNGLTGFTPVGMAKNILTVGAWGAAVSAAMMPVQLAQYSLARLISVGEQTARLEQVFKGVGGSARELTDDVLALAAANGRSTDEAVESAIAWSRLGLSRVQVNEAVRVSLVASNVAELTAGEATKHLSALMAAYGLSVAELDGVLGMLNNTSNKYNVTNADLLQGLSRTAAVAKQAGIPLAELQGMIGAAVGRTGQTGANIANSIKSVLVNMGNPDVQEFLQTRLGLEVGGAEVGQVKTMSQVMRELYTTYVALNDEQRRDLTRTVAGRTQASRFVAILESWPQAMRLAADAQRQLGSAQEENTKIIAQQKAQLAGLRTAWDRFTVTGGNARGLFGGPSLNEQMIGTEGVLTKTVNLFTRLMKVKDRIGRSMGPVGRYLGQVAGSLYGGHAGEWLTKLDDGLDRLAGGNDAKRNRWIKQAQEVATAGNAFQSYASEADRLRALHKITSNPNARRSDVAAALKGEDARLGQLYEQNQALELNAELERRIALAVAKGNTEKNRAIELQGKHLAELNAEISEIEQAVELGRQLNRPASGWFGLSDAEAVAEGQDQLKTLYALKREAVDLKGLLEDIEDIATGDLSGRRQRTVNLMAVSEAMGQQLEALYEIAKPETAVAQLERQGQMLGEQIAVLDDLHQRLKPARPDLAKGVFVQLQAAIGARAVTEDPGIRAAAAAQDRRNLFARRAGEESEDAGLGTSEAERLLNREKFLREQLADLRRKMSTPSGLSESETLRALVFQNQLMVTREQIQTRITRLVHEERQARLEGQREFQRSLLFAGPGELLRKLAAQRISQQPLNAGRWFALSPEMRQEVDMISGGEAMRRIREERARLRPSYDGRAQAAWQTAAEDYQRVDQRMQSLAQRGERDGWSDARNEEWSTAQRDLRASLARLRSRYAAVLASRRNGAQTPEEQAHERANPEFNFPPPTAPGLQLPPRGSTAAVDATRTQVELTRVATAAAGTSAGLDVLTGRVIQLGDAVAQVTRQLGGSATGTTAPPGLSTGHALGESQGRPAISAAGLAVLRSTVMQ